MKRCDSRKQQLKHQHKPFVQPNINAGTCCEMEQSGVLKDEEASLDGTEARVAFSFQLGLDKMHELIAKVNRTVAQVCHPPLPPITSSRCIHCSRMAHASDLWQRRWYAGESHTGRANDAARS
jgi:deferrochelatase/peroxidase EfeB